LGLFLANEILPLLGIHTNLGGFLYVTIRWPVVMGLSITHICGLLVLCIRRRTFTVTVLAPLILPLIIILVQFAHPLPFISLVTHK
jgi:hypothetical protein